MHNFNLDGPPATSSAVAATPIPDQQLKSMMRTIKLCDRPFTRCCTPSSLYGIGVAFSPFIMTWDSFPIPNTIPRQPNAKPVVELTTARDDVDAVISAGEMILTGIVRKPRPYNPAPTTLPIVLKTQNGVHITW